MEDVLLVMVVDGAIDHKDQAAVRADLKVKADVGSVSGSEVRTALLTHAAHQLNRLKSRHTDRLPMAAE